MNPDKENRRLKWERKRSYKEQRNKGYKRNNFKRPRKEKEDNDER